MKAIVPDDITFKSKFATATVSKADLADVVTRRAADLAVLWRRRNAHRAHPRRPKMIRLIAAIAFIAAIATPALACEWNQSAGTGSQSTVASQSGGAQQSKPVQRHTRS